MKQLHHAYAVFTIRARFAAKNDRIPRPLMLKYQDMQLAKECVTQHLSYSAPGE